MTSLTTDAFARAHHFMRTRARPLERARFAHRFEGAPAQAVVEEVAAYRNADGGFGRALEPDCRYEGSWPLATTVALALLHDCGVPADAGLVRGAVEYLAESYDAAQQVWPFAVPGMNDVPHAPWWHFKDDGAPLDTFNLCNPLFAVVGCFHLYPDAVSPVLLKEVTAVAMARLAQLADPIEKHVWRDAVFLQQHLPDPHCGVALAKLRQATPRVFERDAAKWGEYGAGPLWCAPAPDAPLADTVDADVQAHLDFEIARQDADGSWKPLWTWMGQYPAAWETAKEEWAGQLTLEMLTCLRAYGRIADLRTES